MRTSRLNDSPVALLRHLDRQQLECVDRPIEVARVGRPGDVSLETRVVLAAAKIKQTNVSPSLVPRARGGASLLRPRQTVQINHDVDVVGLGPGQCVAQVL
jgi:hypothetical protein